MIDRSVDAVSNIERGISLAGYDTLERLATGLGVPVASLFAETEEGPSRRTETMERLIDAARSLDDETLIKAAGLIEVLAGRSGQT